MVRGVPTAMLPNETSVTSFAPTAYTNFFPLSAACTPLDCFPASVTPLASSPVKPAPSLYLIASAMPASVKKPDAAPFTISVELFAFISGSVKLPLTATPAPVQPEVSPRDRSEVVPVQPARSILFTVTLPTVYFTAPPSEVTLPVAVALYLIFCGSSYPLIPIVLPVPLATVVVMPVALFNSVMLAFFCSALVVSLNFKSFAYTVLVVAKVEPDRFLVALSASISNSPKVIALTVPTPFV